MLDGLVQLGILQVGEEITILRVQVNNHTSQSRRVKSPAPIPQLAKYANINQYSLFILVMNRLILLLSTSMELHDKIKLIRLSKNLTQVYLAEELGIDSANYSRLERGETKISTERLQQIAQILDIDSSILLNKTEDFSWKEGNSSVEILKEILLEIQKLNKHLSK